MENCRSGRRPVDVYYRSGLATPSVAHRPGFRPVRSRSPSPSDAMTTPVRSPRSTGPLPGGSPTEPPADEVVFQPAEPTQIVEEPPIEGSAAPAPYRPGWLRPRPRVEQARLVLPEETEPTPPSWRQRTIGREGARGILVSLVVHVLLLLGMSLWIVHQTGSDFGMIINSAFVTDDVDMIADVQLQEALDDPGEEAAPLHFVPVLDQLNNAADFTPSDRITGMLEGDGNETDTGAGGRLPEVAGINVPTYAITKGSFSVWTEPKDPRPNRPYHIMIQIRVPTDLAEKAKVFSFSRDITANVKGTDGYTLKTNFKGTPPIPIEEGYATTFIVIPGAQQLVRDHIKVTSKMLKETQEFDIEF